MQFSMTDRVVSRPTATGITTEQVYDDHPDLSWLEQDGYGHDARLDSYGVDWHMVGVVAHAEILIPAGDASAVQVITSPGLWSIESDSAPEYIAEIEDEEISALRSILDHLNVDHSNV